MNTNLQGDFQFCFSVPLNMEDITNIDYNHAKIKVCRDFEIKHLEEYHDLYLTNNAFLLASVFENFRKMCSEIYELEPPFEISFSTRIGMTSSFKKRLK